jgi:signal transduction histidine kinase/ActR/RegA family two-component response regulator
VSSPEVDPKRVLIVPPTRRDGSVTRKLLAEEGIQCEVCSDLLELAGEMAAGVAVVILTSGALTDPQMPAVLAVLQAQPAWSDIPIVLLTQQRDGSAVAARVLTAFTNVTLLDLPASTRSMVSAVQAALRARLRQYEIREQIERQRKAEEALREADQRKNEFIATLAHELRNPLAPIRTGLQALSLIAASDPTEQRLRDMMLRQVTQLVKLIDDLLDVSRIATGKMLLAREPVDMRSVVEVALESSQSTIEAGRHRLQCHLPDAPLVVLGDPARLAQVVSNLLNNAAKYTPPGGAITVDLKKEGDDALLRVTDTGAGIPADMLENIFDMFTQVNRTLDRAEGGLGIGLSLVRRLIQLHGGSITASSRGQDQGSTFTLRLPALPWQPASQPASGGDARRGPQDEPRRVKVLVVDDNLDAAETLAILLEAQGHHIRTEHTGMAALKAAAEFHPDVVICDIGLPGMSGHQVAMQLRADGRYASTVLVALTGWGTEADKRRTRDAGFDYHLVKPVSIESVNEVLARFGQAPRAA